MKKLNYYTTLFLLSLTFFAGAIDRSFACSNSSYLDGNNQSWVIKSFDFGNGSGYVFVNDRNVSKKSLTLTFKAGKSWVSKFSSVTFNQVSLDFPFGGMNEMGLNMEILWLDSTVYSKNSKKKTINESQIIQYVLDTAKDLSDAISQIKKITIVPILAPVHYMICDRSNQCAVIEYLNKKLIVTKMKKNRERILQNSNYVRMRDNIRMGYGSERNSTIDLNQIFSVAKLKNKEQIVKKSFDNLDILQQRNWSKWQIVYNLSTKEVWFRTFENKKIKYLNLKKVSRTCTKKTKEKIINIDKNISGDVTNQLETFSSDINTQMLDSFDSVPSWIKFLAAKYLSINHTCKTKIKYIYKKNKK